MSEQGLLSYRPDWDIVSFASVIMLHFLLPIATFIPCAMPEFGQPFGWPLTVFLFLHSLAGLLLDMGTVLNLKLYKYSYDLDIPLPTTNHMKETNLIIVGYLIISLVLATVFLVPSFGLLLAIPEIIIIANVVLIVKTYRMTGKRIETVCKTHQKRAARRPPVALTNGDVREMYDNRNGQALLGVLELTEDPELRALAARLLGELGDPSVCDELEGGLYDKSEEVQVETAIALCRYGIGEDALDFFIDWDRLDRHVKLRVIDALLILNTSEGRLILQQASEDEDQEIASKAREALIKARSKAEKIEPWEWKSVPEER